MRIQQRSYNSKLVRPAPRVHVEGDGSLLIVATSWGQPEHADLAIEEVAKYVNAARGDIEVTSPFGRVASLSDEANHLRIAALIANDVLYRNANRDEYVAGIELTVLSRKHNQLTWLQVGSPHLLLRRSGQDLTPFAIAGDQSFELRRGRINDSPLPSGLLGADSACPIQCGDLYLNRNDLLVLLAASVLPADLWAVPSPMDLPALTQALVRACPDAPFWLALVDFE